MNDLFFGKTMVKVRNRIKIKNIGRIDDEKIDDENNDD